MPIEAMNRTQVITELASYTHPQHYHSILSWSTEQLKALLTYYRTV